MALVSEHYVTEVNETNLTDSAIDEITSQLDPHTVYLRQKELKKFLINTSGRFGGVGISMGMHKGLLTVIAPIAHSPAKAAGIQSGDVILKINNHSTLGLSIEECVAFTKGEVGSSLELTILRKTEPQPLHYSLKRAYINTHPLFATQIQPHMLYISLPTFNQKSALSLAHTLQTQAHDKGIILDLRYNPGGVLSQAVAVVDMFIDHGLIVKQQGHLPQYNIAYYAHKTTIDSNTPLVILINQGSASASEIVSGALQSYKRATLVGEKSFGKGSVQTLFALDDNSALKMTIAKYYLPNGKCIDKVGIIPDYLVKNHHYATKKVQTISYAYAKRTLEKLNRGTLHARHVTPSKQRHSTTHENTHLNPRQIAKDKQLCKAIELLKNSN